MGVTTALQVNVSYYSDSSCTQYIDTSVGGACSLLLIPSGAKSMNILGCSADVACEHVWLFGGNTSSCDAQSALLEFGIFGCPCNTTQSDPPLKCVNWTSSPQVGMPKYAGVVSLVPRAYFKPPFNSKMRLMQLRSYRDITLGRTYFKPPFYRKMELMHPRLEPGY